MKRQFKTLAAIAALLAGSTSQAAVPSNQTKTGIELQDKQTNENKTVKQSRAILPEKLMKITVHS